MTVSGCYSAESQLPGLLAFIDFLEFGFSSNVSALGIRILSSWGVPGALQTPLTAIPRVGSPGVLPAFHVTIPAYSIHDKDKSIEKAIWG